MKTNGRILFIILLTAVLIITVSSCVRKTGTSQGQNQPPSAVLNIYPMNYQLLDETDVISRWTQSTDPEGGAVDYIVQLARSRGELVEAEEHVTSETQFEMENLEAGSWYWQVTARDNQGNMTKSEVLSFTVNGIGLPQPADPEDILPDPSLMVGEIGETSFTLDWPTYIDPTDNTRSVIYAIYLYEHDENASTRENPIRNIQTTDNTYTFDQLEKDQVYDWEIFVGIEAASDQENTNLTERSATSRVIGYYYSFGSGQTQTNNQPPSKPTILFPLDGATDVTTPYSMLEWEESTDPEGSAVKYYVYIRPQGGVYNPFMNSLYLI